MTQYIRKVAVLGLCVVVVLLMASPIQGQQSKKDKITVTGSTDITSNAWLITSPLSIDSVTGKWKGKWHCYTWDYEGPVEIEIKKGDAKRVELIWNFIEKKFTSGGMSSGYDAPPATFTGFYDDNLPMDGKAQRWSLFTVILKSHSFFGDAMIHVTKDGRISGYNDNFPIPIFDRGFFSGTISSSEMRILWTFQVMGDKSHIGANDMILNKQ